jgi:hypothetical protein
LSNGAFDGIAGTDAGGAGAGGGTGEAALGVSAGTEGAGARGAPVTGAVSGDAGGAVPRFCVGAVDDGIAGSVGAA